MCFSFYNSHSFRPSGSILGSGSQWVKAALMNLSLCFHFLKKFKNVISEKNFVLNSATYWKKTQQPGNSATVSSEKMKQELKENLEMNRSHSSYFIDEVTEFDSEIYAFPKFSTFDIFSLFFTMCCAVLSRSVVSNSLQPLGLGPTWLLCPWHSPGKNTGVGYLFPSRESSPPRNWTRVSCISCIRRWFFPLSHLGSP